MTKKPVFLLLVLVLFASYFLTARQRNLASPIPNESVIKKYEAGLIIKLDGQEKSYNISQFIGKTVFAAMEESKIDIKKSGEGENIFITSLEGRMADTKKREFWEFLVKGKQASVGAGSYIVQNGDQIKWQISNY